MAALDAQVGRKELSGQMLGFGIWAGITAVGAFLKADPSGHGTHTQLGLPPCPSVLLADRPCPGCGLTTSFTAFIHGDFATAFKAHALGPVLYLSLTVYALAALLLWIQRRPLYIPQSWNRALTLGVVVFVSYGIVRAVLVSDYRREPESRYVDRLINR